VAGTASSTGRDAAGVNQHQTIDQWASSCRTTPRAPGRPLLGCVLGRGGPQAPSAGILPYLRGACRRTGAVAHVDGGEDTITLPFPDGPSALRWASARSFLRTHLAALRPVRRGRPSPGAQDHH
jgi:hypothetical protein